jgi:hypothetical protein
MSCAQTFWRRAWLAKHSKPTENWTKAGKQTVVFVCYPCVRADCIASVFCWRESQSSRTHWVMVEDSPKYLSSICEKFHSICEKFRSICEQGYCVTHHMDACLFVVERENVHIKLWCEKHSSILFHQSCPLKDRIESYTI